MKRSVIRILFIGFLLVMSGALLAQFPKVKVKIPKKIPGLDKVLKSKPPITTSILDAVTEVPFLDDYNPRVFMAMDMLPRTQEGGFVLERPGDYAFEAQSYCLKAGTYIPGGGRGGEGYLFAPQKGPLVDVVRNILQRSYLHQEIPQRNIQVLLWAIIARTKISDMSREMQLTAAKLLTPKEILRVNGGALGLIPKSLTRKAFENLPAAARQILEAEAQLRRMLAETHTTYEELERVAVLRGDPPPQKGDREVPRGRWSFHPDGYFIRYFPQGYKIIQIELSVPELCHVERDERGRITLIDDKHGNHIETDYNDSIEPLSIRGESSLKGYAFRTIRFVHPDPDNPGETQKTEWRDQGWTFIGIPAGGGRVGDSSDRFSGLKERYDWCKRHKQELDSLSKGLKKISKRKVSQGSTEEIMAFGHYAAALKEVINSSDSSNVNWIVHPVNLVKKAWQYSVSEREGGYLWSCAPSPGPLYANSYLSVGSTASIGSVGPFLTFNSPGRNGGDEPVYNPCAGMAQPGQGGRQRVNQSGRPTDKQKCQNKARKQLKDDIKKCFDEYGPGGIFPCDFWPLYNCLLGYPKGKKYKCFDKNCQMPDAMDHVGLMSCLLLAMDKWQKAHDKCK
jgi:hypothetical protein